MNRLFIILFSFSIFSCKDENINNSNETKIPLVENNTGGLGGNQGGLGNIDYSKGSQGGLGYINAYCIWCGSEIKSGSDILLGVGGGLGKFDLLVDSLNKTTKTNLYDFKPFENTRICSLKCYKEFKNEYFKTDLDTMIYFQDKYHFMLKRKKD